MDYLLQILGFPYSVLLAVAFLLAVIALNYFAGDSSFVKVLASTKTARWLLAIGALLFAVEGTWSIPIHKHFIFPIYALVLLSSLLVTILKGIRRKAKWGFLLSHLGIFLIVWASTFGAPDVSRLKMVVPKEQPIAMAYAEDYHIVPLPFEVQLEDFKIDYYPDSICPKQFTSSLIVEGKKMDTSVNSPCYYDGYAIYQDGYDPEEQSYSVLQLVKDPWLPFVYFGMLLLAAGSSMMLFSKWKAKSVVPIVLVLTILFTILTVAKINFGTLMPALRSWWFVPHLFIYMVAYSLMALALVVWIVAVSKKKSDWQVISDNLVRSSSALLIIGMLTGSVWANQAWGNYWAWDAKENWAAVTWLVSLIHLHLQAKKGWRAFVILLLAFLALQITWYGVNYLPSAVNSLHTYN